jgi:hypothetical protein
MLQTHIQRGKSETPGAHTSPYSFVLRSTEVSLFSPCTYSIYILLMRSDALYRCKHIYTMSHFLTILFSFLNSNNHLSLKINIIERKKKYLELNTRSCSNKMCSCVIHMSFEVLFTDKFIGEKKKFNVNAPRSIKKRLM